MIDPQPPPTIHVLWSGKNSVGKRSVILDRRKPEGLAIIHQIVGRADIVVANMLDDQMGRLGTDAASLGQRNPSAIGLQITATRRRANPTPVSPHVRRPPHSCQIGDAAGTSIQLSGCDMFLPRTGPADDIFTPSRKERERLYREKQ
ncbi:MAG TPA: CoA transferase [Roseiarcus sp.]|nr:CoA transferase [Roseiarcus sp.]